MQVWAIDLDPKNIAVLIKFTPLEKIQNLRVSLGNYPSDYSKIPANSFNSVLLSHVAHYYSAEIEDAAFKAIFNILVPGGKLYLQALTLRAAHIKIIWKLL